MSALADKLNWYVPSPHPAIAKLASFGRLKSGWAFGEGVAFAQPVLFGAEQIIDGLLLHGHSEIDTFPGRDGQIVVTAYGSRVNFDFSISEDAHAPVRLSFEVDGDDCETPNGPIPPLSMENTLSVLGGLSKWLSCESFIPTNTRAGNDVSKAQLSNHQVMAPGYRFSNLTAPLLNRDQSARTLNLIIAA